MYILDYLVNLVGQTQDPRQMRELALRAVAIDLGARSCRLFIYGSGGELASAEAFDLHPGAADGGDAERLARDAVENVRLSGADTPSGRWRAAPLVSRARRLGVLVIERAVQDAPFAEQELSRFSAIAPRFVDLLESAKLLEVLSGKGEARPADDATSATETAGEEVIEGVSASPGIAVGVIRFRHAFPRALAQRERRANDTSGERDRLRDALQRTENDLLRTQSSAASELGEEQALIFGAHLLLLRDPHLLTNVEQGIRTGLSAAAAADDAFTEVAERLRHVSDPYLQERIEDVEDLRSRLLGHLIDVKNVAARPGHVVVSPRMSPSIVMELKAQGATGVASEHGGFTSHGALLARALGVPAVAGVAGLLARVLADDVLIIDGDEGRVVLRPNPETRATYSRRAREAARRSVEFSRYRDEPSRTADGISFQLAANVSLGIELDAAVTNGAEGVGLYRTEFAFLARDGVPSRDEQARIYAKAYAAFPDRAITFRILDLAGDKFVPLRGLTVSPSAFHGYRSIRVLFDYPHILRDQVQAFALAADGRPLRILVPMVSSLEELRRVKQLALSALAELPGNGRRASPRFGAMLEVPAAVELVEDLASEADFFSVGTNDLIQYLLVVDREDARLSSPHHAFHPALWRVLRRVTDAAHAAGKEISVCGEMAARPAAAIGLVALGVDTLSLPPRGIPELKQKLSRVKLQPLRDQLDAVLRHRTTAEIEHALRGFLREQGAHTAKVGDS